MIGAMPLTFRVQRDVFRFWDFGLGLYGLGIESPIMGCGFESPDVTIYLASAQSLNLNQPYARMNPEVLFVNPKCKILNPKIRTLNLEALVS